MSVWACPRCHTLEHPGPRRCSCGEMTVRVEVRHDRCGQCGSPLTEKGNCARSVASLAAPAPDTPAARPKYQPIPILTGCCIACGDRLDITQGPVNDVTCVRVRPHCACNQGVHLWQSLAARAGPRSSVLVELRQLERARDAAIAHIANGDPKGALAALTMQRDTPDLFDQATFDGDQ